MLFAADIGNTNTVIGIFEGDVLRCKFRVNTNPNDTSDEISLKVSGLLREAGLSKKDIRDAIICSVVPVVTPLYREMAGNFFGTEPLLVGPGIKSGISIQYDNPREVGADRVANAVGGFARYGGPLIIVDLGTAITFDAVSANGEYLGGVIAPGVNASMSSLSKKAAQLPQVGFTIPQKVIGKNTVASMQSGAVFGFGGMIDSIVKKMKEEMGGNPRVIATGGQSGLFLEVSETLEAAEPDLTLYGLYEIYRKNKKTD